jgi:hypothetical protein
MASSDPLLLGSPGSPREGLTSTPLRTAPRRPHRTRPAGPAAGLGRRAPHEPGRLPSDRPGACAPSRQSRGRCSRSRAQPTPPFTRRAPHTPSSKGGGSRRAHTPSRFPRIASRRRELLRAVPHREKDASHRLLQPTLDTSTPYAARLPTARFLQPRCLSTSRPSGLRRPAADNPLEACAPLEPPHDEPSGGASLDGEPPASAPLQPFGRPPGAEAPSACRFEHRASQVRTSIEGPSRRASRLRPCQPRAEHAALPLTPSVTTARQGRPRPGSACAPA